MSAYTLVRYRWRNDARGATGRIRQACRRVWGCDASGARGDSGQSVVQQETAKTPVQKETPDVVETDDAATAA